MNSARLTAVKAHPGLVDGLLWTAQIDQLGQPDLSYRLVGWEGLINFTLTAAHPNAVPTPWKGTASTASPVSWIRDSGTERPMPGGRHLECTFRMELPYGLLAKLERFRNGGVLHAQLVGSFLAPQSGWSSKGTKLPAIIDQVGTGASSTWQPLRLAVRGVSWHIPRDDWSSVVAALLGEERHIMEVAWRRADLPTSHASGMIAHLNDARSAIDKGQYAHVPLHLYKVLEPLVKGPKEDLHRAFGTESGAHVDKIARTLKALMNSPRHSRPDGSTMPIDRAMAEFLYASTATLLGVMGPLRSGPEAQSE